MRQECRRNASDILFRFAPAIILINLALSVWILSPFATVFAAPFAPALPSSASCSQLARIDPTATNGAKWGATLLPGLGAPGGWFGVPVCANSINQVAPGGANLSCNRMPSNFPATGCAPGGATSDGYGLTFQCVELVARFSAWAFGAPPSSWHGDAQFLWLNGHHPVSFSAYSNGGTYMPLPGDILVWGTLDRQGHPWPSGPAGGHVAVVAAVSSGRISFVEENMLVRGSNIPEETTTLTQNDGHWRLGPTYGTNGGRALYGWLHKVGNSGHFNFYRPGSQPVTASASLSGSSTRPSLAKSVIVTGAGALAQLVWSDTHTAAPALKKTGAASGTTPQALVESLGTPPGATLAPNQAPAVVILPGGERYSFALGQDGRLYASYTPGNVAINGATSAIVLWQALGAPPGITLTSAATALWDGENIMLGALGSDGAMWIRTGPPGMLDAWVSLGKPSNASFQGFQGTPVLIRAPGSPAPSASSATPSPGAAEWLALALGHDGAIYENDGYPASANNPAPVATTGAGSGATQNPSPAPGWSGWAHVAIPGLSTSLAGPLLAISEPQTPDSRQPGSVAPAIRAVNALAMDTTGRLWLLRHTAMNQPWQARSVQAPDTDITLLSASLAPLTTAQKSAVALVVYVRDPQIIASQDATQPAEQGILASALSLTAAGASQTDKWELLGFAPLPARRAAMSAGGSPVALELGSGLRALLLARGAQVALIGDHAALSQLAPEARSEPTPTAVSASHTITSATPPSGTGLVILGDIAPAAVFSGAFNGNALDSRWLVTGAPPGTAQVGQGALTLTTATPSGRVAVAQGAPSGAFSVTAQITPDSNWRTGTGTSGSSAQAGILLALDDWNKLTLSIRADGIVALCPVEDGKTLSCDTAPEPTATGPNQKIYLRISQSGAEMIGAVSADGVKWTQVGVWGLPWLPTAEEPLLGAYAPPVAPVNMADSGVAPSAYAATPLTFTSLSLFVEGANTRSASGVTAGVSAQFNAITVAANTNVAP